MSSKPTTRCSELPQILTCAGSRTLSALVRKDDAGGPASWEGNWGHHRVASRLIAEEEAVAPSGGLPAPKMPVDYQPSPFAFWMADFCYSKFLEPITLDWAILVEREVVVEFPGFSLSGHADAEALRFEPVEGEKDPQVVEIYGADFKFGALPVDPADINEQVMGYVVQRAKLYPHLRKVTWQISQPRAREDDGYQRVSEVVVEGREALDKAVAYLEAQVMEALKNFDVINSDGGRQCRWCPAAVQCPALNQEIKSMIMKLTSEQITAIKPDAPLSILAEMYDARKKLVPVMARAYDALKSHLIMMPGKTDKFPDGRKACLKARNGPRTIINNALAQDALADLPDDLYLGCIDFNPNAIERALAKHRQVHIGGKGEVTGEKLFVERLGQITAQEKQDILVVE